MKRFLFKSILMIALASFLVVGLAVAADGPSWIGAFFVKGKVGLKWQDIEGSSEYRIYRMAVGEEYAVLISQEKTHYFDTEVAPGTTYKYKIAAVLADGSEAFSTEKTVSIPGSSAGEFKAPIWSGLRVDRQSIFLKWDKVGGALAYNVYRSATTGTGYEMVGNSPGTKYADKQDLEPGVTYYYVVTAINEEFEETEYSEEMSLKFGMSAEERKAAENADKVELVELNLSLLFEISSAGKGDDMNQPADIVINSKGDIYVNDVLNMRICCFDSLGKFKFAFGEKTPGGQSSNPPGGTFALPLSIAIDNNDLVYVGDVNNHEIQIFQADGKYIKKISPQFKDGMNPLRPNGIAVLDDGRILCTDAGNHRFLILSQDGKVLLSQGDRGGDPGQFNFPDGIAVTKDNLVCVVDQINTRVQIFDLDGKFIREFGHAGQSAGTFGRPKSITVDDKGQLWVSDGMGHTVQVFSIDGVVISATIGLEESGARLATPRGLVVRDGKLYVVNRLPHRVLVFKIG